MPLPVLILMILLGLVDAGLVETPQLAETNSDKPVPQLNSVLDSTVVFTPIDLEPPVLYTRTFKVDPMRFRQALEGAAGMPDSQENLGALFKSFVSALGLDVSGTSAPALDSHGNPITRTIFCSDRSGAIFARATLEELDILEQGIKVLGIPPREVELEVDLFQLKVAEQNKSLTNSAPRLALADDAFLVRFARLQSDGSVQLALRTNLTVTRPFHIQLAQTATVDLSAIILSDGLFISAMGLLPEFGGYDDPGKFISNTATDDTPALPTLSKRPLPRHRLRHLSTSWEKAPDRKPMFFIVQFPEALGSNAGNNSDSAGAPSTYVISVTARMRELVSGDPLAAPLPATGPLLSADEATKLARDLANARAKKLYDTEPFSNKTAARLIDGRWHWRQRVGHGPADFEATVELYPNGAEPKIEVLLLHSGANQF